MTAPPTPDDLVEILRSVPRICRFNVEHLHDSDCLISDFPAMADALLARLRPGWDSLMESNLKWFEESKKAYATCDALRADLRHCAEALARFVKTDAEGQRHFFDCDRAVIGTNGRGRSFAGPMYDCTRGCAETLARPGVQALLTASVSPPSA